MQVFTTIADVRQYVHAQRLRQKRIGLVPTMGALHEGHLALVRQSKRENDVTIVSIYVNPTQFNNPDDLVRYPRPRETDERMLREAACDALFAPADQEMYPQPPRITIDVGFLNQVMEGKYRKGHFNGVAIVVSKLFHTVQPDAAYFGQKDLQQFVIIRQLVTDLSFPVRLVRHPIIREDDGLAMSSRNRRLTAEQRALAPHLYQALVAAQQALLQGEAVEQVKKTTIERLSRVNGLQVEYVEIVDSHTLMDVHRIEEHVQVALCIAAYLGDVRLLDNLFLYPDLSD